MPEFKDRVLQCVDCGTDFVFTAGEQLFYADKHFKNDPKRCRSCKQKRAAQVGARPGASRVETSAVCSQCGKTTTVPFRPTQGRPVFCRECLDGRRENQAGANA
jgi:CxxC-x17-CxxC domain-containing protein